MVLVLLELVSLEIFRMFLYLIRKRILRRKLRKIRVRIRIRTRIIIVVCLLAGIYIRSLSIIIRTNY